MHRIAIILFAAVVPLAAADPNDALLSAARKGDLNQVKASVADGAALETKTPYGQTPLYLAAMNGHEEVVRFLLEKGASADIKDTFYKAPMLDFVLMRKHFAVAKLLITKGNLKPDDELSDVADSEQADLVQAVLATGKASQAVLDKTYEAALDQKHTAIADMLKKAGAHEPAPPVVIDPKVLESYAGTYKSEQLPLDIKVSVKDGKLYLQATGQPEFAPKAKSPTSFEMVQYQLQVDFDSAASFTLKQGGREFKFKKGVTQ